MAQSRLERIGTIYSRAQGLIKSGGVRWEDRPLWFDLYEAFPPKEEPKYDRPAPNIPLRHIFYEEDKIRAIFHRNNKKIGATHLLDTKYKTLTQKFIESYRTIQAQYGDSGTEEQIYKEAIDLLKKNQEIKKDEDDVSLSTAFKESLKEQKAKLKINVSDIFKA
ncbi:probable 28S ribosomal protein S23, mitochondrial [Tribolium madens]|uniref:probable 28S ribosomal protein S23, mitochondrial n=1 Tax=Tribolium madens TaxID=41895 RepID=UPI001CF73592|nr:probable 28S ribosomal protein S23, mitochondrial [Tribolium madens]